MKTLAEIKADILMLAAKLGVTEYMLPGLGQSHSDGSPFVELGGNQYHYVAKESAAMKSRAAPAPI